MERLPIGPSEQIDVATRFQDGVSRLVDMSVACRYLCAQCQVRQGKWNEATEMLGEANPFRELGRGGPDAPNIDGGIKVRGLRRCRGFKLTALTDGSLYVPLARPAYAEAKPGRPGEGVLHGGACTRREVL